MRWMLVLGGCSIKIITAFTLLVGFSSTVIAQSTVATGAVTGIVSDPSGAPAIGEHVLVSNPSIGQSFNFVTSERGLYSSGPIAVGAYTLQLDVKGFTPVQFPVVVLVGTTTSANIRLQPSGDKRTYDAGRINSAEATVQGVVTAQQLDGLPINGRNFFDLAQLEPGVQIRDAAQTDPSKSGYFAVSIESNPGRSTRTILDGIDITDERVGTTTQNISLSAIQQFQVAQSSLNISSPMTSSGTINAISRTGNEGYHGGGFYGFRDNRIGFAAFPGGEKPRFQRNQFGGNFGGALIKNRLFFFLNGERAKQDARNSPALDFPFNALGARYSTPFRDNMALGRLDWVGQNARAFYRGTYEAASATESGNGYSPFVTHNNAAGHALGADFYRGNLTHSIRLGYTRYSNHVGSPNESGILNASRLITIQNSSIDLGTNALAGESATQSSIQFRYDGSKVSSNHIFRFGAAFNRIASGDFHLAGVPVVTGTATFANEQAVLGNPNAYAPALVAGDPAGALDNPLNYPVASITISDGQRFSSEKSAVGLPHGGLTDNRIEFYVGDAWKAKKNLTVNYGVHYLRDGGLTNSDLVGIAALSGFGPSLGGAVHQPNLNFSPQLGIAWAPLTWERTIFRAGIGLYYDSQLSMNIEADRALRLQQGQYSAPQTLCGPGAYSVAVPNGAAITSSDGLNIASQICGHALSEVNGVSVAKAIADLQSSVQAASAGAGPNGFYAGTTGSTLGGVLSPNYVSPRSLEMNFGLQHQFGRSTILSMDYLRNSGTHFLVGVDRNHVGDAGNFNFNNALAAINRTLTANAPACGQVNASTSIAGITCYLRQVRTASISDFAVHGLDSSGTFANPNATFPGDNATLGRGIFYEPIANSRYRAIDIALRSAVDYPVRGVETMNLQVAYSWSKFESNFPTGNGSAAGQGGLTNALDWDRPNAYFGPSGLDRAHQFTFGPVMGLKRGFRLNILGHLDSPLPLTVFIPQLSGGGTPGEIFRSDVTGDGTVGDVVTGSAVGAFRNSSSTTKLNTFINSYNVTIANRITPAGSALTSNGLFTSTQLLQLGAVTPALAPVPTRSEPGWLKTLDLKLSWAYTLKELFVIEPSVSAFNVFNFANFDSTLNSSSGILQPATNFPTNGSLGLGCGTASSCLTSSRVGQGSGLFSQGSPRQVEFGLRLTF